MTTDSPQPHLPSLSTSFLIETKNHLYMHQAWWPPEMNIFPVSQPYVEIMYSLL